MAPEYPYTEAMLYELTIDMKHRPFRVQPVFIDHSTVEKIKIRNNTLGTYRNSSESFTLSYFS